jgi:3-hydroxyacyl-[acyl-carrier-protein] dehydratase
MTNIQEILSYLPHRYPFLLIDRIVEFEAWKSLTALKNVTINEPFFNGHFPGQPIMPGVLMIEALAQAAGIVILKSDPSVTQDKNLFLLAGVDRVRFKRMVIPGDQLHLKAELVRHKREVYKFYCEAIVGGELACSAEITNIRRVKNGD